MGGKKGERNCKTKRGEVVLIRSEATTFFFSNRVKFDTKDHFTKEDYFTTTRRWKDTWAKPVRLIVEIAATVNIHKVKDDTRLRRPD